MSIPRVTHQFADVQGVRVFYRSAGPGDAPALLLLHGFPSASHQFRRLIDALGTLWVPNTVSPHATWEYSWIRPPSRSRRRTRILAPAAGGPWRPAGGFWCSVLCGRWVL